MRISGSTKQRMDIAFYAYFYVYATLFEIFKVLKPFFADYFNKYAHQRAFKKCVLHLEIVKIGMS